MNEYLNITRGPSGSVWHAVSLFKLNNSTTKHTANRNPNLYPFSWILMKENIVHIHQTSLKILCTQFCHSPSSTRKIIFPQTLTSEISPGNPACMVLLMTLSPPSSLSHFFVCLFVHLSHYVVSLGLTSFIFILSSHYSDSASSRKAEAWCPQQKSLFLDSKKTRERLKKTTN